MNLQKMRNRKLEIIIGVIILAIITVLFVLKYSKEDPIIKAAKNYVNNKTINVTDNYILKLSEMIAAGHTFKMSDDCTKHSYVDITNNNGTLEYAIKKICKTDELSLELIGKKEITLEHGEEYKETGASAYYKNYDVSSQIKIDSSDLDLDKLGTYKVVYKIEVDAVVKEEVRTIKIVDTKIPELTLKGNLHLTLVVGTGYTEAGFLALDNYDGDITDNVKISGEVNTNKLGTYRLIYEVRDLAGNKASVERIVDVKNEDVATLNLKGNTIVYIEYPNTYVDAGYVADDTKDGIITSNVQINGKVNTSELGTYILTYSVINSSKQTTIAERKVIVRDITKPVITLTGDSYISLNLGDEYIELNATANDNYDGDLTNEIKKLGFVDINTVGKQYITYEVIDTSGNKTTVQRIVEIKDVIKPVITIETGKDAVTIERTENYNVMDDIIASDNYDGDLTNKITYISNPPFNKDIAGIYSITFSVKDSSGNVATTKTKVITVKDTLNPKGNVSYSTTDLTNQAVKATITADEDIKIDDASWGCIEKVCTKEYNSNTTEEVVIKDLSENAAKVNISINNIDKNSPIGSISYSSLLTNSDVTVTLTASKPINTPIGWTRVNDKKFTKAYSVNATENVTITDRAGNTNTTTVAVNNIDKRQVTGTLNYSNTNPTNQDIKVTLTTNKKILPITDWTKINDTTYTKIFTTNVANEIISFTDFYGNKGSAIINIDNIDKTVPKLNANYNILTPTNGNVTVTVIADKKITSLMSGWICNNTTCTKIYNKNANEVLSVEDMYGNTENIIIKINNIDKVLPTGIVSYSETAETKNDVLVTITGSKNITIPNFSCKDNICTKSYKENIEETLTLRDMANNTNIVNIRIYNIDKTSLEADVDYSITSPTNDDIIAMIIANKDITTLDSSWNCHHNICQKKYLDNINETVVVNDIVGNTLNANIDIKNIDRIAPIGIASYSQTSTTNNNVIATISGNKDITIPGWTCNGKICTKEYVLNKTENITITDAAGNTNTVDIIINNITKISLEADIDYSLTSLTNNDVIATITANKYITMTDSSWQCYDNICQKAYSANMDEIVVIEDMADNTLNIKVLINNIDKTSPTGTVSYHPDMSTKTNDKTTVTITGNENIIIPGWTCNEKICTRDYLLNKTENIIITDAAGNTSDVHIIVTNIDKDPINGVLSYSTVELTQDPVLVTLTTDKIIKDPTGWRKIADKHYEKEYTTNLSNGLVVLEDKAGNTENVYINIINIDASALNANVSYDMISPTNGDVEVTITTDKEILPIAGWIKINATTYKNIFTMNFSGEVIIEDLVGKTLDLNINIANIDKVPIKAVDVTYSTINPTNEDVIVMITLNKNIDSIFGYIKTGSFTYEKSYKENITNEIVNFSDTAGNKGSTTINITNIDTKPVTGTLSYNPPTLTNGSIIATIASNKNITIQDVSWNCINNICNKVFIENEIETVIIKDIYGNDATVTVIVDKIDKIIPTADITYSVTTPTNGDVTVTLKTNKEIEVPLGWTKTSSTIYTKIYNNNVTNEKVILRDLVGNTGSTIIEVSNIDKTGVSYNLNYNPDSLTSLAVKATITANKNITIPYWNCSANICSKVYNDNVSSEIVTMTDLYGNTIDATVSINWIDKTKPEVVSKTYTPTSPTNGNVLVELKFSKAIETPLGWIKINDKTFTKTYTDNITNELVSFSDLAGNTGNTTINISNINRTPLTTRIAYSTTNPTKDSVTVTLTISHEVENIPGWTTNDNLVFTKVYNNNTANEVINFTSASSTGSAVVNINNIDKLSLSGIVTYSTTAVTNKDVEVTINANKEILALSGWTKISATTYKKTFSANFIGNVTITDLVGNTYNLDVTISNIDNTAPEVLSKVYSQTNKTNKDVNVKVTFDKEVNNINGWTTTDNITFIKVYNRNINETVNFSDKFSNKGTFTINISNIDKTPVTGTIKYNPTVLTNNNVTATITGNKNITIPSWACNNNTCIKAYSNNTNETVTLTDEYGNSENKDVFINNIDKIAPELVSQTYSTILPTNKDVTVTLVFNEEVQNISGWTTLDNIVFTKVYSSNVKNETVNFTDLIGNTNSTVINITVIDKNPPTYNINYNPDITTNTTVTATISANKDITISGFNCNKNICTKVYTDNTNSQIIISDLAGNTVKDNIVITWIEEATMVTIHRSSGEIVQVELEEYITGVVAAEMPAAFNVEALKAQSTIARTYALNRISKNQILTDNTTTQAYIDRNQMKAKWGASFDMYHNKIKNAVASTSGQYITYNRQYIDAVFFSTSNGYTEDAKNVWGGSVPYLKSVKSPWDVGVGTYLRTEEKDFNVVMNLLGINITNNTAIEILSRNESGRVSSVKIGTNTYTGVKLRNLLKTRSADFDIKIVDGKLIFTTRGYGHGVGMSQYGANGMASEGYNYKEIISHYYTGVTIVSNK